MNDEEDHRIGKSPNTNASAKNYRLILELKTPTAEWILTLTSGEVAGFGGLSGVGAISSCSCLRS